MLILLPLRFRFLHVLTIRHVLIIDVHSISDSIAHFVRYARLWTHYVIPLDSLIVQYVHIFTWRPTCSPTFTHCWTFYSTVRLFHQVYLVHYVTQIWLSDLVSIYSCSTPAILELSNPYGIGKFWIVHRIVFHCRMFDLLNVRNIAVP